MSIFGIYAYIICISICSLLVCNVIEYSIKDSYSARKSLSGNLIRRDLASLWASGSVLACTTRVIVFDICGSDYHYTGPSIIRPISAAAVAVVTRDSATRTYALFSEGALAGITLLTQMYSLPPDGMDFIDFVVSYESVLLVKGIGTSSSGPISASEGRSSSLDNISTG